PLLGSYLLPEPGSYVGLNKYSLILDNDNRIWRNEGEYFNPVDGSVNVSARHAELDLKHSDLKDGWQKMNKINKKLDWGEIAKYGMWTIAIIAVMIVAIVGLGKWGEAQEAKAESDQAFAQAVQNLDNVVENILESKNTDILILEKLNERYN